MIGDDVDPHGVSIVKEATGWKLGSDSRPVPPMTAMRGVPVETISIVQVDILHGADHCTWLVMNR